MNKRTTLYSQKEMNSKLFFVDRQYFQSNQPLMSGFSVQCLSSLLPPWPPWHSLPTVACFGSPCNEQQCPQPSPAFLSHLVPSPACVGTAVAARRPFPPSSHSWAWECFNAPDVRGVARQSHEDWQRSVWGLHLPDVHGIILSGPGKRIAVSVSAHYAPIFQFLLYQCNISWDSSPP